MKVHFPLLGFNLSGGIRVIIALANGLVRLGHEVRITVPAFRAEPPFPVNGGVEMVVLGSKTASRFRYVASLADVAAKWGDVLVATNFKTPAILARSIKKNRSPSHLIYLVQNYEPISQGDHFSGPFWRRLINRHIAYQSYGRTRHRFYVSRDIARRVCLDENPCIVPPGIDADVFRPEGQRNEEPLRIGAMSIAAPVKGFETFVSAMRELSEIQDRLSIELLQVGDSPGSPVRSARFHRTSDDEELSRYYRSLDLFVFPSLFEGFGLPPLEAMACGVPVVLTDCGGVSEFAVHEENCLIVPTRDSGALAAAIRRMIDSPELRERLRTKGLETARQFTWENTVERFHEGLLRVVNQSG
jgi:glycosyltransferase involved in cell wall biosynthesis